MLNSESSERDAVNAGMPPLNLGDKPVSYFEFWPAWFFYIPIVFYWIYLSIRYRSFGVPMACNPNIYLGGMVGESKIDIMNSFSRQQFSDGASYWLPFIYEQKDADGNITQLAESALKKASEQDILLPFVIKPDLGCRGHGVSKINSETELVAYLKVFPVGRRFIIQALSPHDAEAGIFYVRQPNEECGKIISLTLKYRPYVCGDGTSTLRQLILSDSRAKHLASIYLEKNKRRLASVPVKGEYVALAFAGSHAKGSIFRNGAVHITEALTQSIDDMAKAMPNFYYGRFDIKFEDIHLLEQGKAMSLIEVNGASSEATHIWDSRTSLSSAFKVLFFQYRTIFAIGDQVRQNGGKVPSVWRMVQLWIRELRKADKYPRAVTEI